MMELTFVGNRAKRRRPVVSPQACDLCGAKMIEQQATSDTPYPYTISGLKNVFLVNIPIKRCSSPACAAESVVIPQIAALHRILTEELLSKRFLLSGSEIRFLRKNAGIAAKSLAAKLNITPAYLSRVENGKSGKNKKGLLGPQADKLIRAIIAVTYSHDKEASKLLLSETEMLPSKRPMTFTCPLNRDRWGKIAVAQ